MVLSPGARRRESSVEGWNVAAEGDAWKESNALRKALSVESPPAQKYLDSPSWLNNLEC